MGEATPSWMEEIEETAGPFFGASSRLRALSFFAGLPPRGRGLARLAEGIDRWAEEELAPEIGEEAFLEGAGALLALILIASFEDARHVEEGGLHRLRVGADAFLDPFGAVEAAIEAEAAAPVLAEAVRAHEAEVRGVEGFARACRRLDALLVEHRPDLRVEDRFPPRARLVGGIELDLSQLLRATEGEGERALDLALLKLISMIPGGAGEDARGDARALGERLLPRLLSEAGLASLRSRAREARAKGGGAELAVRPFAGSLRITLIADHGDRARYVREDELSALQSEGGGGSEGGSGGAWLRALANLAARSGGARFTRHSIEEGELVIAESGDGLDAARLLLPSLHAVLSPTLGSPFLVAIPHRDTLLACAAGRPALAARMRERAEEASARAPHAISSSLFLVDGKKVRPFDIEEG